MNECYGRKFVLNGQIQPSEIFDNSLVYDGDSIYEVIRMIKGTPVFFHDHMERLESSAKLQRKKMLADEAVLRRDVLNLVKTEKKKDINLKIVFNYNRDSFNYLVYFIEPIYPSDEQYRKGVRGILFYAERKNPESKVINHKLRSSIYHKLILEGGYEALLVNEQNCITEGSRSNIFFLKGDSLVTAPDDKILSGITRKYIIEICRDINIRIDYRCVPADSLKNYDAVFMTGTSPMVLQFCCINDVNFKVPVPLIEKLRTLYVEKAMDSVLKFTEGR
ncbi:MAG: aminotransferase class IV [Bacteroidales bacterium]|jgi:branched-chain amino acid aminotransferase|nr:aminotransferase class IV [Bacteroidales bacterium]